MKLAICTLKTTGEQFTFYGDYEIQEETEVAANADSISYKYPEFDGITTKRYVNGTEEDYIPTQSTWSGRKIDCEDMLGDLIAYSMR